MATFNDEDLIKWNDLSTSLKDIIMRKITWNMLHPDLQSWLLDKERRIIELERWRRTKADPMLDDHERRIGSCESQITSLWSKLGDTEDQLENIAVNAIGAGKYTILSWNFSPEFTGIIVPDITQFACEITASFKLPPGFTTGIAELEIITDFTIRFTRNVSQYVYVPIGPFGQNIATPTHLHFHISGDIVYTNNTEFYWNPMEVPDPFPCHTNPWPPGFPGSVFRPCFPYARFVPKIPNNILAVKIIGSSFYNSLDPMTFKTFDVNKLYNYHDGGYFYSLPDPRDFLTSVIAV